MVSDHVELGARDVRVELLHGKHDGKEFAVGGSKLGLSLRAAAGGVTDNVVFVVGAALL